MNEAFLEKFNISNLKIQEFDYWILSVRPQQVTLGALVLSLKRHSDSLSDLREEESTELSLIFKYVEKILKPFCNYERINYLCLMMFDFHVHFHIIPRYNGFREFNNIRIVDNGWPGPPVLASGESDSNTIIEIRNKLIKK
ncbi:MAG: HIT family protein [Bacteroidales bacterium]|nr:HIT family protein [Bacteroidales bacterium]